MVKDMKRKSFGTPGSGPSPKRPAKDFSPGGPKKFQKGGPSPKPVNSNQQGGKPFAKPNKANEKQGEAGGKKNFAKNGQQGVSANMTRESSPQKPPMKVEVVKAAAPARNGPPPGNKPDALKQINPNSKAIKKNENSAGPKFGMPRNEKKFMHKQGFNPEGRFQKIGNKKLRHKRFQHRLSQQPRTKKDCELALAAEDEMTKTGGFFIVEVQDPPITLENVKALNPSIDSVIFRKSVEPRQFMITMKPGTTDAAKVMASLNKSTIGGLKIKVSQRSSTEAGHNALLGVEFIDPYTFFVTNIAEGATKEDLVEVFSNAVSVSAPKKHNPHTNVSSKFSFVNFRNAADALKAYKENYGKSIKGNALVIRYRRFGRNERVPFTDDVYDTKGKDEANTTAQKSEGKKAANGTEVKKEKEKSEAALKKELQAKAAALLAKKALQKGKDEDDEEDEDEEDEDMEEEGEDDDQEDIEFGEDSDDDEEGDDDDEQEDDDEEDDDDDEEQAEGAVVDQEAEEDEQDDEDDDDDDDDDDEDDDDDDDDDEDDDDDSD